jgi:hypothetical protein
MKLHYAFARFAYGFVAVFFWLLGAIGIFAAFAPRHEKSELILVPIFAIVGFFPFLRYRYWTKRAAELNARDLRGMEKENPDEMA